MLSLNMYQQSQKCKKFSDSEQKQLRKAGSDEFLAKLIDFYWLYLRSPRKGIIKQKMSIQLSFRQYLKNKTDTPTT